MQCVMATILVLWSWLAACIVHTLWTCAHRREDKRAMGIPFSVQLPSERAEQFLNRCNIRVSTISSALHHETSIEMWAVFGTALGLARHGARIPWDDDYDMAVWVEDWPRIEQWMQENGQRFGIKLGYWWKRGGSCVKVEDRRTGACIFDIFAVRVNSQNMVELAWHSLQRSSFNKNIACPLEAMGSWVMPEELPRCACLPFHHPIPMRSTNTKLVTQFWWSPAVLKEAVINPPHTWLYPLTLCNPFLQKRFSLQKALRLP